VEAEASAAFSRSVTGSLRYTYLHTRVVESGSPSDPDGLFVPGKPLIRRPAHTIAPQLAVRWGGRGGVTLGALWIGKRDDLDFRRPAGQRRITVQPYTRVNLAARYGMERGRIVVTGRVANLFNDHRQDPPGFRVRGRTIFLGVRIGVE